MKGAYEANRTGVNLKEIDIRVKLFKFCRWNVACNWRIYEKASDEKGKIAKIYPPVFLQELIQYKRFVR